MKSLIVRLVLIALRDPSVRAEVAEIHAAPKAAPNVSIAGETREQVLSMISEARARGWGR